MKTTEKAISGSMKLKSYNAMEFLNRAELKGMVGSVRIEEVGEARAARFSLVTNYCYRAKDGSAVVETTWHSVVCFEGKGICPLEEIKKGEQLHVLGRIRMRRYVTDSGEDRKVLEIVASRVGPLSEDT